VTFLFADLLERYGGHAAAAGFTVRNENIEALQARLLEVAEEQLRGKELYPALEIDGEILLNQCSLETAHELAKLEPCGEANRLPIFMSRGVMICNSQQLGREGRHLKLEFTQNGPPIEGIAFRMGEEQGNLPGQADIAYHIEVNEWNGQRRLQLNIKDIRPAE
jgi:single-stranded-DNA-specific exonuclease